MIESISRIFWGLILVSLNINIGPIDILPDIVGYAIIIYSLLELAPKENKLRTGCYWIGVLMLSNLFGKVMGGAIQEEQLLRAIWSLGVGILQLIMMYYLHQAVYSVIEHIEKVGETEKFWKEVKESNQSNWNACVGVSMVNYSLLSFSFYEIEWVMGISVIVTIVLVVIQVQFLVILYRVKKRFVAK